MFKRFLNLSKILEKNSIFLLGPRQTGKSSLIRKQFSDEKIFDLLEADTFRRLSANPENIRLSLTEKDQIVIIDEIQKLPILLDEVHLMIERNKKLRFILTGSSARKLKSSGVNLLAGRVWSIKFHPLIFPELENKVELMQRLNLGGLPVALTSDEPQKFFQNYVGTYLQEEIRAEGLARSIENFSRFIEVAASVNCEQVNFTKVGNDSGIPPRTIREYFQLFEDTLIGYLVKPYQKTIKRKPVATSKFYFFDVGVANFLLKRGTIQANSELYGKALEHLIFLELRAYIDYHQLDLPITFWRSQSKMEVDFVIGDSIAIEVKSSKEVSIRDCKGLLALEEEVKLKRKIIICNSAWERKTESNIEIINVDSFFKKLWADEIIN